MNRNGWKLVLGAVLPLLVLPAGAHCGKALRDEALINAVANHRSEDVEALLRVGENPNLKMDGGLWFAHPRTPDSLLAFAAFNGDVGAASVLLSHGADPNSRDGSGVPALLWGHRHTALARMLLEHGAQPNLPGPGGAHSLAWAASARNVELVALLLRAGAEVNTRSDAGDTALIEAAKSGSAEAVTLLLDHGADPSPADIKGRTALEHARRLKHWTCARLLKAALARKPAGAPAEQ